MGTYMEQVTQRSNNAPVIRIWSPEGGNSVMEKLKECGNLQAILQRNGITDVDIMPPLPHRTFHFDEDIQYVMYTTPRITLGSPAAQDILQAILNELDLVGTVAGPFEKERTRNAYATTHGLKIIHSQNIPPEQVCQVS